MARRSTSHAHLPPPDPPLAATSVLMLRGLVCLLRLLRPLVSAGSKLGSTRRLGGSAVWKLLSKGILWYWFWRSGALVICNLNEWLPGASKTDENVIPTKNTMFCGKTRCFRETPHFRLQAVSHTFLQLVIRSQKISKASSQPQNLPSPSPFALATKSASHSPLVFRNSNLKEGGRGPK